MSIESGALDGSLRDTSATPSFTRSATPTSPKIASRTAKTCKNFFALGLIAWMYTRPVDSIMRWIDERFGKNQIVHDANLASFKDRKSVV